MWQISAIGHVAQQRLLEPPPWLRVIFADSFSCKNFNFCGQLTPYVDIDLQNGNCRSKKKERLRHRNDSAELPKSVFKLRHCSNIADTSKLFLQTYIKHITLTVALCASVLFLSLWICNWQIHIVTYRLLRIYTFVVSIFLTPFHVHHCDQQRQFSLSLRRTAW